MRYIQLKTLDPYFNLAFEQAVFENIKDDDILLVWQNEPCIVCGRNQNIFLEVDLINAQKNGVKVLRRDTGGGAVYHDLGNVNVTFITDSDGIGVSYDDYLDRIVFALNSVGIAAHKNKACDIAINNKKISGNAQRQTKTRTLYHGTLLFSTDLKLLSEFLPDKSKEFVSKGIASNRSEVTNISEHTTEFSTVEQFISAFITSFQAEELLPSDDLIKKAKALETEKYRNSDWLLSKNPYFERKKQLYGLNIELFSRKGRIEKLCADGLSIDELRDVRLTPNEVFDSCMLLPDRHMAKAIFEIIFDYKLEDYNK